VIVGALIVIAVFTTPAPVTPTVRVGCAGSFVVNVIVALVAPIAVGVYVTVNWHGTPGSTLPQLEAVDVKSGDPAIVLLSVRVAFPVLEIVTWASCPFANVVASVFTLTLPNASTVGAMPAIGTALSVAMFDHPESSIEVGL
jgi:hypothetical protein